MKCSFSHTALLRKPPPKRESKSSDREIWDPRNKRNAPVVAVFSGLMLTSMRGAETGKFRRKVWCVVFAGEGSSGKTWN